MDHLVSLSVGTNGEDDFLQTHQDLSELARNLGTERYVSVTANVFPMDEEDDHVDENVCLREHLTSSENTLEKVLKAIQGEGFTPQTAMDIVNAIQNAGILFRERFDAEDLT